MYAIKITNDEPDECELWGPYETEDEAQQVIDAYVGSPSSARIVTATDDMESAFTGSPL